MSHKDTFPRQDTLGRYLLELAAVCGCFGKKVLREADNDRKDKP